MTLRTLLGFAPTAKVTTPLPVLPPATFTLADPATFPCAFLDHPEVDLRADR
jgi:hypothetical protein